MKTSQVLPVFAAVSLIALTLSGCAPSYSKADALNKLHSVIETDPGTLFILPSFGYVNNEHQIVPMGTCDMGSLLEQAHCQTKDGVYRFYWSTTKYGDIVSASITVDGVSTDLTCNSDADKTWDGLPVCLSSK